MLFLWGERFSPEDSIKHMLLAEKSIKDMKLKTAWLLVKLIRAMLMISGVEDIIRLPRLIKMAPGTTMSGV